MGYLFLEKLSHTSAFYDEVRPSWQYTSGYPASNKRSATPITRSLSLTKRTIALDGDNSERYWIMA